MVESLFRSALSICLEDAFWKSRSLMLSPQCHLLQSPCCPKPFMNLRILPKWTSMSSKARSGLDENDLWIAATALALGATLVSRDADVQQIGGLRVEDWTV